MKNFGKASMFIATLALASVGSAATILPVGATQTYGTPIFPGGTTAATWVSLASIGTSLGVTITPGTTSMGFTAVGAICYNPGAGVCGSGGNNDVPVGSITNPIFGGFTAASGSTAFLGGPNNAVTGDWTVDFANDFVVSAAGTGNILVPVGAGWVVFAFRDSYYADNVDLPTVDLGVSVTASNPSAVPEPATYAMMLAGLGAVAAFKRFRRS